MTRALSLDVFVRNEAGRKGVPISRSFEAWIRATLEGRRRGRVEVNIALLRRAEARRLNREFRGRDYATNVLSFPYEEMRGEHNRLLGDLAICPAVVAREAREQGKRVRDHFAHLVIHGTLHLIGFDHGDDAQAAKMETLERRLLAGFGIGDPYAER